MDKDKQKNKIVVGYFLDHLQNASQTGDVLKVVACLFELKFRIAESRTPSVAKCCFKHDILSLLLAALSKEYRPREEPLDTRHEVIIYAVGMEIVWFLSRLQRPHLDPLLSSPTLVTLLTCFLNTSNRFYQFRPSFEEELRKLCCRLSFPQQNVMTGPMSEEVWKDVLYYRADLAGNGRVSHLHQCSLTRKTEDQSEKVSVATQLTATKYLAWPDLQKTSTTSTRLFRSVRELVQSSDDNSSLNNSSLNNSSLNDDNDDTNGSEIVSGLEDVYVLDLIGGHYFWAYVGRKTQVVVRTIANDLKNALPNLSRCHPFVGDLVAVLAEKDGQPVSAMRAKVLKVNDNEVTVLAVDYGSVKKVEMGNVYRLSESVQHLREIEPQAKVCCLAGVQAPPAELRVVEFSLATLINLTAHQYLDAGVKFESLRGIDHLHTLLRCGPHSIQLQAVRLLVNLSSSARLAASVDWSPFIRPLLELLVQLTRTQTRQGELDSLLKNILVVTLFCLGNILYRKPANHQLFFNLEGHLIVLNVTRVMMHCQPVVQAADRTLKAAYPGLVRIPRDVADGPCDNDRKPDKNTRKKEEKEESSRQQQTKDDNANSREVFSDDDLLECSLTDETRTAVGRRVVPVNGVTIPRETGRVYELNKYVSFQDDVRHFLHHANNIDSVSSQTVLEVVCGMLNSEGGTIYLGITKQGRIRGLPLVGQDKDEVRLKIDEMMSRTEPSIPFNLVCLKFCPVGSKADIGDSEQVAGDAAIATSQHRNNCFVIEITVRAPDELQCYKLKFGSVTFRRVDSMNKKLTAKDVQELVVRQKASQYLPVVETLRQRLQHLQDELL